jgi:hypothetical protein
MNGNLRTPADRTAWLETFTAELTRVAYGVVLQQGTDGTWLDLELDLWRVLSELVQRWERDRSRTGGPSGVAPGGTLLSTSSAHC